MKKGITLLIVVTFLGINSYCQKYPQDQFICPKKNYKLLNNRDTINKIYAGKKEGLWIIYMETLTCYDCQECSGGYSVQSFNVLKKGKFFNGLETGIWISYPDYITPFIKQVNEINTKYVNGKRDSTETFYGTKEIVKQINWNYGIKDSTEFEIEFHESKRFTYWNKGTKDSILVYRRDGSLNFYGIYKNNQLNEFKILYSSGQIKYHAIEIRDLKAKELKYYTEYGENKIPRDTDLGIIGVHENVIQYY